MSLWEQSGRATYRAGSVLLSGALLYVAGCSSHKPVAAAPGGMGPLPVSVTAVQQADVPLTGEWVGTMDGYVNAQIQPQVSGYLGRQLYREGSPVAKGQVLFQIDPRPFQAAPSAATLMAGTVRGRMPIASLGADARSWLRTTFGIDGAACSRTV